MEQGGRGGIVWITGASSGIGRALGPASGARRAGAWSPPPATRRRSRHWRPKRVRNLSALPLDTTDASACETAIALIEAEIGPIGLAVLNAGTHLPTPATKFAVAPFRHLVETNLMGTVNALAPALATMRARKAGHIAVVASVAGYGGLPTASAYGATKAALINMCEGAEARMRRAGREAATRRSGFRAHAADRPQPRSRCRS